MDFWIIIISAIAIIASLPYIKSLFVRTSLFLRLVVTCKKYGMKLYGAHPFWVLAGRGGKACDFHIETSKESYSVKLFGVPRRLSVLVFTEDGRYFIRYFLAFLSYTTSWVHYPIDGRRKVLRAFDFDKGRRKSSHGRPHKKILLINPSCREIRYIPSHGTESIIGCGDIIQGLEIESLSHFIERLGKTVGQSI